VESGLEPVRVPGRTLEMGLALEQVPHRQATPQPALLKSKLSITFS